VVNASSDKLILSVASAATTKWISKRFAVNQEYCRFDSAQAHYRTLVREQLRMRRDESLGPRLAIR